MEAVVGGSDPLPVDIHLVREIHRRWFETTFPTDAGKERSLLVVNRKGTAIDKEAIVPAVIGACDNWNYRRQYAPSHGPDLVQFLVAEANTLVVAIYDVHPFIDGNTRTTWSLRNYVLMRDGLRPLVDLHDWDSYEKAWMNADAFEHKELDDRVLDELASQDR